MAAMSVALGIRTTEDIRFDEEDHTYWLGLERVPGVSEILRPITESYLIGIPEAILNRKRDLGIAVHRACEIIDRGMELDPDSLDDDVNAYLEGYRRFLIDQEPRWEAIEKVVFEPELRYAGKLDRVGIVAGHAFTVDIKTSLKLSPANPVQLVAYRRAYGVGLACGIASLQLTPKGEYVFVPYDLRTAMESEQIWDALRAVHAWKEAHP